MNKDFLCVEDINTLGNFIPYLQYWIDLSLSRTVVNKETDYGFCKIILLENNTGYRYKVTFNLDNYGGVIFSYTNDFEDYTIVDSDYNSFIIQQEGTFKPRLNILLYFRKVSSVTGFIKSPFRVVDFQNREYYGNDNALLSYNFYNRTGTRVSGVTLKYNTNKNGSVTDKDSIFYFSVPGLNTNLIYFNYNGLNIPYFIDFTVFRMIILLDSVDCSDLSDCTVVLKVFSPCTSSKYELVYDDVTYIGVYNGGYVTFNNIDFSSVSSEKVTVQIPLNNEYNSSVWSINEDLVIPLK